MRKRISPELQFCTRRRLLCRRSACWSDEGSQEMNADFAVSLGCKSRLQRSEESSSCPSQQQRVSAPPSQAQSSHWSPNLSSLFAPSALRTNTSLICRESLGPTCRTYLICRDTRPVRKVQRSHSAGPLMSDVTYKVNSCSCPLSGHPRSLFL